MKSISKIKNLKTEFSTRNATNFAESKVILGYLEAIGLNQALQRLGLAKAVNAIFPTHRMLQMLIIGWILGYERLFQFKSLQGDALIAQAVGGRVPHYTLLNKDLLRLGKAHVQVRWPQRSVPAIQAVRLTSLPLLGKRWRC